MSLIKVDLNEIYEISRDILTSYEVTLEDSEVVINSLLDAEISGVSSHGLLRLKSYTERIESGVINVHPKIRVEKDLNNVLLLNGDNGLGQVVAQKAIQLCFDKLSTNSAVTVLVQNSNHFGTSGFYTKQAASRGYLSLVFSNAGPTMAPWGGTEPLLGTNPLSAAFPGSNTNFMLDMATSASAKGKIRAMKNASENIPKGWAIDEKGDDTQDPDKVLNGGTMLPIGNHKGYGLSMLVDTLCAGLTGASLSYETVSVGNTKRDANIGHFFYMIKIDDLLPLESFQRRMDDWFETIKTSNKREGFEEIYIPGEIEEKKKDDITNSIHLNEKVYKEILKIAEERKIS
ncbi:Ldh family oxidoreductase [Lentibacillus salicampi]|nr:Ldh family oxidoreductase [Lentibacillus salicampi]